MPESAIRTRPAAPGCHTFHGSAPAGGHPAPRCRVPALRPRLARRRTAVAMGDIGEEITEIELEPLPEEIPAGAPAEPVTEPVPS
jgi:hypothetical protein